MNQRAFLLSTWLLLCLGTRVVLGGSEDFRPDRLIAKYKVQADPRVMARGLDPLRFRIRSRIQTVPRLVVLESVPEPGTAVAKTDPVEVRHDLRRRMERLRASGQFEYVEPDYAVHGDLSPNDTAFTTGILWGLRNTGSGGGLPGADIQATNAWNITTGSTNVIVAVIDTGIRYTHHDLAAQMWHNPTVNLDGYAGDVFGINAITGSGDPNDDNGHGTHVAGTIGAAANDGNPHVGVAWHVQLMACKFLNANGDGYTSDAITCIDYAVARGARLINASWGGDSYSQALFDAISAAGAHGVLVVAAAGNDSADNDTTPSYPCNFQLDNVISVAAVDRSDKLASFSDYGTNSVHLGAPGVEIYSCLDISDTSYGVLSGTSMAAPHVTGTAALLLARYPSATPLELRQRLLTTVVPTPALAQTTQSGGRLNAYGALAAQSDGHLQLLVVPGFGSGVVTGQRLPLQVRITDLLGITNATVTAVDASGNNYPLRDNGLPPDAMAGDARYTGWVPVGTNGGNVTFTVAVTAPGKQTAVVPVAYPLLFPPVNDDFSNSLPLIGTNVSVTGSNIGATKELGEPDPIIFNSGGASVWWHWQAPANGVLQINTQGSSFETLLAVDLGDALDDLTGLASDDNSGGAGSFVTLQVTNGLDYHITVDGWSGATGQILLNLSFIPTPQSPANDDFTNATVLSGYSVEATGSNISATKEPGEPDHDGNPGGHSVWWTWTAPAIGNVQITTDGSDFETTVAVYTGSQVANLVYVSSDTFSGATRSLVTFDATAGTTYQIAVDGYDGAFGQILLTLGLQLPPPPPANDNFVNAIPLSGTNIQVTGSNVGATKEPGEPGHAGNSGGKSAWWSWTTPAGGYLTVTTSGSDFDTLLDAYIGTSVTNLKAVASNNNDPLGGVTSQLAFVATAGVTYWIAVDGNNLGYGAESGDIVLNLTIGPVPVPASNDYFINRTNLAGWTNFVTAYSGDATIEPGEPEPDNKPGGKSLWWTWTAPGDGTATINTFGSDFDTLLAVHTGDSLLALVPVAANDDSGPGLDSMVNFPVTAGAVYQITVDGFRGASGMIQMALLAQPNPPPPPNDNFADRLAIPDLSELTTGSNVGATREPGEPAHLGQTAGHSVWWNWQAPTNALVVLNTDASDFDTTLSVYTGDVLTKLTLVAADAGDDSTYGSQVSFLAVAGQVYQIAVDGNNGAVGNIVMQGTLLPVLAPVITVQPQNRLVYTGSVVAFTLGVASAAPIWCQWLKNGVPLTNDAVRIFGADTTQLVLLGAQGSDAGVYTAVANNVAGFAFSAPATLRVNTPFQLTAYPSWQGSPGGFSLGVGGLVGSTFQLETSTNLLDWSSLGKFTNLTGLAWFTDSASLFFPSRFYRAVASGP